MTVASGLIKAVIHDWNDTADKSWEGYQRWYSLFAEFFNLRESSLNEVRAHWGKPPYVILNKLWPEIPLEEAPTYVKNFTPGEKFSMELWPGVLDSFNQIKTSGLKLGILSSGTKLGIGRTYRKHIGEPFCLHDIAVTAEDTPVHKPDPAVFDPINSWATKNGIKSSEYLYVGDGIMDWKAARDAKVHFVGVLTGLTTKEDFVKEGLPETQTLDTFAKLPKYLNL